jgi:hypothetical protein
VRAIEARNATTRSGATETNDEEEPGRGHEA